MSQADEIHQILLAVERIEKRLDRIAPEPDPIAEMVATLRERERRRAASEEETEL